MISNPFNVDSSYDPPFVESSWYEWWEKQGFFSPEYNLNENAEVFTMIIPPPNVTGSLHLGHALTNSIQDAIVRYHRMNGKKVLWLPGTDHAGIATQAVVEKMLWKEEKKTRQQIGREDFVELVWKWKKQYGDRITQQLRRIGSSLDWKRERFSLDERLSRGVTEAFVRLYKSGKLFRGTRLVNWSCKLRTAISDIEVENFELTKKIKIKVPGHNPDKLYEFGAIWEFAYKIEGTDEELIIATTRPETMLGDTAIAIHPDDERYKHLKGKYAIHPFINRRIPIIEDSILVDMSFGTGAVKITPAHDQNDYACGERNKLEFIKILNLDGTINSNGGQFCGMMRFDARIAIIGALKEKGLYRGVKDNPMKLGKCSRSGDIIEPMLLPQWWVKCGEMAKSALDSVKKGDLKIIPEMHVTTWNNWLSDCRDWCISRQLWWGHRIPAWLVHLKNKSPSDASSQEYWVVGHNFEEAKQIAENKWPEKVESLEQDPDVLDTWFSSGIFPFSVFGWPQENASESDLKDLNKYYPNSLLETGHDILFFWVARMVMLGLELTSKLPFNEVLLHAMVRDSHGRKMSKSLGNVIDPVDVIEGITKQELINRLEKGNLDQNELIKATQGINEDFPNGISECGTDALRFALCAYTSQGRDINLDILRVQGYRNFCNKIWNATKLIFMVLGMLPPPSGNSIKLEKFTPLPSSKETFTGHESLVDLWIISRLNNTISETISGFSQYDFSKATTSIYSYWLYDFCDVYIESIKPIIFSSESNPDSIEAIRQTSYTCLEEGLRLIHPFMPFLSEELWQRIPHRQDQLSIPSICLASYPSFIEIRKRNDIEKEISACQVIIHSTRSLRTEYNITKKSTPSLIINTHNEQYKKLYTKYIDFIKILSYSGIVKVTINEQAPSSSSASIPNDTCEIYLLIKGIVDSEQEIKKLKMKMENLNKQKQILIKRIESPTYSKVPENVHIEDLKKQKSIEDEIFNLSIAIKNFEKLE